MTGGASSPIRGAWADHRNRHPGFESHRLVGLPPLPGIADAPIGPASNPASLAICTLLQSARSLDFWFLFLSFFICGLSTNGLIGTHFIPLCIDHRIPEGHAAGLLAVVGVFD